MAKAALRVHGFLCGAPKFLCTCDGDLFCAHWDGIESGKAKYLLAVAGKYAEKRQGASRHPEKDRCENR